MKILVIVPSVPKYNGVDFHRLVMPHNVIGLNYPDFDISIINEIDSRDDEFLKGFDLLVANRFISKTKQTGALIQRLKELNLPYVLDLDDDYKLQQEHILYTASKENDHPEHIIRAAKGAIAVTVTQEILAATLKAELGLKRIAIIPNGIYPIGQFEAKPPQFEDVRFGWSGSITHFDDVLLVHDALRSLYCQDDFKGKFKMIYGGYSKDDLGSEAIAGVLSCKATAPRGMFELYPVRDVIAYAEFYDEINVSLIPLRNNRFNNMKSNLKLLEAGFKKKAVIVSDVHPYSPLLNHKKNCLIVKHKNDWYKNMSYLIKNPSMIEELAQQLYEDVWPYHMDIIAKMRMKVYNDLMKTV